MKYVEWIMLTIQVVVVAVICFAVFGCANTQMVEDAKRDTEYRKSLLEYKEPRYEPKGTGPIEMPQEWMDQWLDSRENDQVDQ